MFTYKSDTKLTLLEPLPKTLFFMFESSNISHLREVAVVDAVDDSSLSGIPEIDCIRCGEFFGVIGRLSLYKRGVPLHVTSEPLATWVQLMERLVEGKPHEQINRKHLGNYIMLYPEPLTLTRVWAALSPLFLERSDLALCCGAVPGTGVVVYLRRNKGFRLLPELLVDGVVPLHFAFLKTGCKGRGNDDTLVMLGKVMSECSTMLSVREAISEFSFQQLQVAMEQLTREQVETLKGDPPA
jgi:hypothetical protein